MFPLVYEINTRVWLKELEYKYKRPVTLSTVPDEEVAFFCECGFDMVWLMGVWRPSRYSQAIAASHPDLRSEFLEQLKDLRPDDIAGSPYAIPAYEVNESLGGTDGLQNFRRKLSVRGIRLMLDFVPNHLALDNRWLPDHPEFFITVSKTERNHDPRSCFEYVKGKYLAHGKDPYFPPWTDTLQLNYANRATHELMIHNLLHISDLCDGVRCDVAMLILKNVFNTTWSSLSGHMVEEFWPKAIAAVRNRYPEFLFLAESYWNREWELQQMGFDFTYDKPFYDYLGSSPVNTGKLREHLHAEWNYQKQLCRFVENHDEIRAATRFGPNNGVAALVMLSSPGMHLVYEGQMEGFKKKVPVQLNRQSKEAAHKAVQYLHFNLFALNRKTVFQEGKIEWLDLNPASNCLCFGFRRFTETESAFVLANFSATGIETEFTHSVLDGISGETISVFSTQNLVRHHEHEIHDATLRIRLAPHEGIIIMTAPPGIRSLHAGIAFPQHLE
jgi:glycosidase